MKFVLAGINAKYIHSNPAIYSLRAYAKDYEEQVEIAEYTINNREETILADLYLRKPEAIGFSCYIWNWNMIQNLLPELQKILPETELWLGGPEVTFHSEEILVQYPYVKGIMVGEGEETFCELMAYYTEGRKRNLTTVKGLMLSTGYTGDRELTPLEKIPFLYDNLEQFQNRIIYYESERGCPFRCSYCLSSIDKKVRLRPLELVRKELQFFLEHQVSQVKFIDRTFNCNHEHAYAIWQYIKEHDNGITNFHFEVAADILTEEELTLLSELRPGLVQLEIGVQSTNPETLQAINRYTDFQELKHIVDRIHDGKNIHQHLDLIAGLPYEDYESFGHSFDDVYALKPQQLQLGFLKVLKGSPMEEQAAKYGIAYLSRPPYEVLCTSWLSYSDILRLKKIEEMVELYYNSNQFTHTLPVLLHFFDRPFTMFEALAAYYEVHGYFVNSPARAYRYQVLLDFATENAPAWKDLFRELMTFDMYLRENLKSRPEFARDISAYKEQIKEFYRQEEIAPEYLKAYQQYRSVQTMKMTHMEVFHYPVIALEKIKAILMQEAAVVSDHAHVQAEVEDREIPYFVLFDYQMRNPLTYEAATAVVDNRETQE